METESVDSRSARILGDNGPVDERFWSQSGLSLLVREPMSPPQYIKDHERDCVPGDELQLGDVVVYFKGNLFTKLDNGKQIVVTEGLDLIRFGIAHPDAMDQLRVISQDPKGNVWDHSIDELPGCDGDDNWDYYGLRLPQNQSPFKDTQGNLNPFDVIDTWLAHK
jgi:hypothetical protein